MSKWLRMHACFLAGALLSHAAYADLYGAAEAYQKQDLARSFELYRELAELGQPLAQQIVAAMYVSGEGVKRDNVLGYAWALIAKESGQGAEVQTIIDQLQAHISSAARTRVEEVQSKFGAAALQERLLPNVPGTSAGLPNRACSMRVAVNPDNYYPPDAKRRGISGTVLVDATVAPDGRPREIHVLSLPLKVFEEAGQIVALKNVYTVPRVDGRALSCTIRFKVNFSIHLSTETAIRADFAKARSNARAGDPQAQFLYGVMLEMRSDLNVDKEESMPWLIKAAQAGIPSAQYMVGMAALRGFRYGIERDDTKGIAWLQLAADAGQAEAQVALANYLLRSHVGADSAGRALALLERAAASGAGEGRFYLAALLATSPEEATRDPKRALDVLAGVTPGVGTDPRAFEARAAAQAFLGDFVAAQADQAKALQMAEKLGWNAEAQRARLALYAASKPWSGNLFVYD
jgi:TPR repeat protein